MDFAGSENWKAKDVARLLSLVESERRYFHDMVTGLPTAVAVVAADLSLVTANRHFRKLFGTALGPEETRLIPEIVLVEGLEASVRAVLAGGGAARGCATALSLPRAFERCGLGSSRSMTGTKQRRRKWYWSATT